jgi:hypothetical protein
VARAPDLAPQRDRPLELDAGLSPRFTTKKVESMSKRERDHQPVDPRRRQQKTAEIGTRRVLILKEEDMR